MSNSRPPRRPVSLSLPSTMAKGPCLGSGGFHSHALDEGRKKERERERESEGVWENAYRCDYAESPPPWTSS